MTGVDLFLGGDIGLWCLQQARPDQIGSVITLDDAIASAASQRGIPVLAGNANRIAYRPAEVGLSVHYPRLLHAPLIRQYRSLYNLHSGLLPWGRGYYPVFWALWEGTPAGATLHEIDEGIDTGPVVDQIEVSPAAEDTGGSLHARVREAERTLLARHWENLTEGVPLARASRPIAAAGSYHAKAEFFALKRPAHWEAMTAAELVRLIRALTFPGLSGLEIQLGDRTFACQLVPHDDRERTS